ncbi:peroxiredoxin family protein, partial [Bacteroidota bacterium]
TLTIIISIFFLISCNSTDVDELINSTVDKIEQYKAISHLSDQKWGNIGDTTDFKPLKGYCTFKLVKSDTAIGAYYSLKAENGITDNYNGSALSRINYNDSTFTITDLIKFPREKRYIDSKMLYSFSVVDIYNLMKEKEDTLSFKKVLKDTIIQGEKCHRILLSPGNPEKDPYFMKYTISINRKTHLPVHFLSVSKSQFGTQIHQNTLSDYKLNDDLIKDALFSDYGVPENFKTIQYTPTKYLKKEPVLKVGMQAPEWKTPTLDNKSISLSSLKGKVNLLVFSGVHCGFCLVAVPKLIDIKNRFEDEKFQLYSFYSDTEKEKLKKYKERYSINYTLLYDGEQKDIRKHYGVSGIPHFFLINETGEITNIWNGYQVGIEKLITNAIEEQLNRK